MPPAGTFVHALLVGIPQPLFLLLDLWIHLFPHQRQEGQAKAAGHQDQTDEHRDEIVFAALRPCGVIQHLAPQQDETCCRNDLQHQQRVKIRQKVISKENIPAVIRQMPSVTLPTRRTGSACAAAGGGFSGPSSFPGRYPLSFSFRSGQFLLKYPVRYSSWPFSSFAEVSSGRVISGASGWAWYSWKSASPAASSCASACFCRPFGGRAPARHHRG